MSIRQLQNKAVANSLGLATLADITASGVSSFEGLNGAITLSSPDASISINTTGNDIELTTVGSSGVASLNGLTGAVTISAGDNIELDTLDNNITINANVPESVTSLNGLSSAVTLSAGDNIALDINTEGNIITINADVPESVTSLNGLSDVVTLISPDASVLIGVDESNNITLTTTIPTLNSISAGTGISVSTASGIATVTSASRQYTLTGTTIDGEITYTKPITINWVSNTWYLVNETLFNVPPNWVAGQSVAFDGYQYLNWNSNTFSFFAIYYTTSDTTIPAEQSLIGVYNSLVPSAGTVTNAISGGREGQAYLPMNLTIPPTYIESGGDITIRVYGLVASALINLVSDPLIDARVSIVYP